MGKLYDVYFTLAESASIVVEADSSIEAEDIVQEMPTSDLLERFRAAIDYKGVHITSVWELENNMSTARSLAIDILEMFEDILDEHGIKVPDADRSGNEDEAALYGMTYADLEDKIVELLENHIHE